MTAPVGRFAPSPSSDLHVGNLRTALLAWWFARGVGGRFLVRIEDLDRQRSAPEVARRQLEDLALLGIDHEPDPLVQSERFEVYRSALARLDTYECFCSRKDIAQASAAPHDGLRAYPGTCRDLSTTQRAERRLTRAPAIRVRADTDHFAVHDRFAGRVDGPVDDFVLVRGDGTPGYNLAVVVDDGLQGVSQVTRAHDLLSSAPRQAWLATALGYAVPEYGHVGLVLGDHHERLAKRNADPTLADLAEDRRRAADRLLGLVCDNLGWPRVATATDLLSDPRMGDWDERRAASDWTIDPRDFFSR